MGTLSAATAPAPYGTLPTEQQVNWLRMEWYAFVHFGLNTYTNREWGYGDESPQLFKPGNFDAEAIVRTFKGAGMNGMIYTAKHHDGFCTWPPLSTKHNITQSPWKGGNGDVVSEFVRNSKKTTLLVEPSVKKPLHEWLFLCSCISIANADASRKVVKY